MFGVIWRRHLILRTLTIWGAEAVGLVIMGRIIPGLSTGSFQDAVVTIALLALINAVLWPFLSRVTFPFLVYTFGLGALLLNGFLIWFVGELEGGVIVESWAALILTPIGLAAISTSLSAVLTIDDTGALYRRLQRVAKKTKHSVPKDKPGVLFLEIDGLAEAVLREALKRGRMPTLAHWLERGSHKVTSWETDLSSQTGASQAGILHGNNQNLPAFRWVEKALNNKIMVSTGLSDAPVIEARISDGKGLLAANGASRSNLFSGDAEDNIFTYSRLKDIKRFYTKSWSYFYANPSNFPRVVALLLWDIADEFFGRVRQRVKNVTPRLHKGFVYYLTRAGANVFLREITTDTLIGDIITGQVDVAYATYVGYDEIAHHNGIADKAAFTALNKLDKQFHRLELAKDHAPRPYHLVVLSDHGQTNGATFKQRNNYDLESLVRSLTGEDVHVLSELDSNQDHFGQAFAGPIQRRTQYLANKTRSQRKKIHAEESDLIVLASGNLGLIYLAQWKERLSLEQLNQAFPRLVPGLLNHEGVGFIMVRSEQYGSLVLSGNGTYYLGYDRVEGENPLANFGPRAAAHLRRTDSFNGVPDILINSFYDPGKDEIAAFEELIGSHGGLGGAQSKPFVVHPSEWDFPNEDIVGAEHLHAVFKNIVEKMQTVSLEALV